MLKEKVNFNKIKIKPNLKIMKKIGFNFETHIKQLVT